MLETFASFLRLVKVHATRPNKHRESDGIAIRSLCTRDGTVSTRAIMKCSFDILTRSASFVIAGDYAISSRMLQTQLMSISKIIERIYGRICDLAKGRVRRGGSVSSQRLSRTTRDRNEHKGGVDWWCWCASPFHRRLYRHATPVIKCASDTPNAGSARCVLDPSDLSFKVAKTICSRWDVIRTVRNVCGRFRRWGENSKTKFVGKSNLRPLLTPVFPFTW